MSHLLKSGWKICLINLEKNFRRKQRVLEAADTIFYKQIGLYLNDSNLIDPLDRKLMQLN